MKIQGVRLQGTKLVPSGVAADLEVSRSLRFNSADSAYLNRTPASAGSYTTWTFSCWIKRNLLGSDQTFMGLRIDGNNFFQVAFNASDQLSIESYNSGIQRVLLVTTQVFRDPNAWYSITLTADSPNATSTDRFRVYINGVRVTNFSSAVYPAQSVAVSNWNGPEVHNIGRYPTAVQYTSAYFAEINFIDGQALEPSSFGETDADTGVWNPKAYTGTYGTNGFYLNFSDNSGTTSTTLGKDSSGNSNNWTPNNFSVTAGVGNDSLVDSPTSYGTDTGVGGEVRGNYCTMNPLDTIGGVFSNGNLDVGVSAAAGRYIRATIAPPSGKWYWEATVLSTTGTPSVGVVATTAAPSGGVPVVGVTYSSNGVVTKDSTNLGTQTALSVNDIVGISYDADNLTIALYRNNALQTTVNLTTGYIYAPLFMSYANATVNSCVAFNFGQRAFAYTAPSGFKALCTQNLPTPTIGATSTTQANDYFNVVLYTGNGSTQSITGVGFQPDTVWLKGRSLVSNHRIYDAIRGATKSIYPDLTDAEGTESTGLTSFNSDGFSVGSQAGHNQNGSTYVAWNWKANGAGSSNTDGTITSTVSANTTSGFSIVTYTGTGANATVGHGLGVTPGMIIVKSRSSGVFNWAVWHTSLGGGDNALQLNNTGATYTAFDYWNGNPTSTVFTLGTDAGSNQSSGTYVAYCFAAVAGYSAFGSYTGNGGTDGPFVFANHRPAFLLVKRTDTTSNWTILDFQREGYNVDNDGLYPNLNAVEGTTDLADLLSSGFKLRSTDASVNASGGTYIYMSIASNPFKYARAR